MREVEQTKNTQLDSALVVADRDRLDNLGLFSEIKWQIVPLEDGSVRLQFMIIESWNNMKGAMPMYSEEYGWSVSGGYIIKNFRGRNQTLSLGGSLGGQNTYGISFSDPWIFGNHVSTEIEIGKSMNNHLFLDYKKKIASLGISVGRYYGKYIRASSKIEFEKKSFENNASLISYKYLSLIASLGYDSRDIYSNPSKGIKAINTIYYQIDHRNGQENRLVWNQSFSVFHSLIPGEKKLALGLNLANQISFGDDEEIWLDYLGGSYSVRGWKMPSRELYQSGNQNYRFGHHWLQSSIELRQTIIPKYATKFKSEFGLDLGLFFDAGMNAMELNHLLEKDPLLGIGFGIRIPAPMMGILRLDYGWAFYEGEFIESSFHLAMGQRF